MSLTVLVIAISLIAILASRPQINNVTVSSPLLGNQAPNISGLSLFSNKSISLNSFKGKYVVINFFASWCSPCHVEEPELVAFNFEHYSQKNVAMLGITFDDTASNATGFLRSNGATWPAIEDRSGSIAISYGVSEPPETFLISPEGIVLAKLIGPVTQKGLDSLISKSASKN